MAFLGKVNSQGTLIDHELFCMTQPSQQDSDGQAREMEARVLLPRRKGSRTFIKTCDKDSLVRSMGSPSTVRYVGSSESSSEVNSLDETETSTLRCCSDLSLGTLKSTKTIEGPRVSELGEDIELQTESETVCLHLGSPSSSTSTDRSSCSSRSCPSSRSGNNSSDKDSTTSMCSWEEAMSRDDSMLAPLELPLSHSLPSLRLGSSVGSPPLTYTRRIEPLHIRRSAGEAYENWLSGKQRQCQYKLQAQQAEREAQRQRTELRQRLAKEKYEQWCQQKAQQTTSTAKLTKPDRSAQLPPQKNMASVQHHLQEWELHKLRLLEQRRLEQRNAERRRQEEKAARRSQAEEAFSRWMSNVAQRPKPVPSSQGMKSLRGTVSDIFINPKQWVN
uniref:AT05371p n=1 Tax=Drosophila melanogaster TaxID=7227 RepID=Q58CJ0_DROME|nr:AT05371p [Drosophila melanogaster]